ncbi:DUF3307 domain-containing protein [Flavobacteriaceae bacterium F08102]|nr:DUF3307 domain-containing protein [Flavobacteriaceae bacterium F08102]
MEGNLVLLLQLFMAHILTDFVLQPTAMVAHKRSYKIRSWTLYMHSVIAGLMTYLLVMDWSAWKIPLLITLTHYGIDLWKTYQLKDNLRYFLIDQFLHVFVLFIAWLYLIDGFSEIRPFIGELLTSRTVLTVSIAYLIVIFPVGFLIGKATERWQNEMDDTSQVNSLRQAGRFIGIVERVLILTLILSNQFAAIGFLIGAKSILRFTETKGARKQTEYVLIGTLMSFAICIIIGILVKFIFVLPS